MRYVQRDTNGKITGHFACQQSYALEELRDDHPEIVDFDTERRRASKEAVSTEERFRKIEIELERVSKKIG